MSVEANIFITYYPNYNTKNQAEFDGCGDIVLCMSQMNLSARAYHRILKLARVVADLVGSEGSNLHIWLRRCTLRSHPNLR